ncbi:hypothetical protein ACFQDN_08955 [Pseudomonas asuensis]
MFNLNPLSARCNPVSKKENFDTGIRPQDDFFKAINGQWLKNTPIPADKTSYGAFHAIADTTEKQLHAIIEELAATSGKAAGSNEQKSGTCMPRS